MTGKDLYLALGQVGEDLVEEGEYASFSARKGKIRRPLLIAAIVALTALLVGCGAVYVMNLQSLRLGETQGAKAIVDPDTMEYLGQEPFTRQVFTVAGLENTPGWKAAGEWFDFLQTYDGERDNDAVFPAAYDSYGVKSQAMKDKVDEICEKYNLKLAGAELNFRTLGNLCGALGVPRSQTGENGVTILARDGSCLENGNFWLDMDLGLPESGEGAPTSAWGSLSWNRKDCFSGDRIELWDAGDWKEWNYTTPSGGKALIVSSPSEQVSYLFFDREEALMTLSVDTWQENACLTDSQLERIADTFDQIQPRRVTQADVANQPGPPESDTQNGFTVQLKSVETDGRKARIVLGITAPEGTAICEHTVDSREYYHIGPANKTFTPADGDTLCSSGNWFSREDGDGAENTQDLVLETGMELTDDAAPFTPGRVWNLHLEDLAMTCWDNQKQVFCTELLTEGEWNFTIPFTEDSGDFREIELAPEPVTVNAITRHSMRGEAEYGDVTITSFTLRALSAVVRYDFPGTVYFDTGDQLMCLVMKDGSTVPFRSSSGAPGVNWYVLEGAVDLDQVEGVRMMDGKVIAVR